MIWNSTTLMSVIDLAVVMLALLTFRYASAGGFFRRRSRGRVLIVLGVVTYALFYAADLVLLHAGAALFGAERRGRAHRRVALERPLGRGVSRRRLHGGRVSRDEPLAERATSGG